MESENIRRHEALESRVPALSAPAVMLEPPPGRILVKEVNWLGDLVMSTPALRAIRRAWPGAHLAVLIKKELASFFDGARWLDEVIPYSVGRGLSGFFDRRRIVGEIRSRRFDLGVLFPNSFESALWIAMAGIRRRAGFVADARGAMLTLKASPPPEAVTGHQVNYWLAMVRATGVCVADTRADDFAIDVHGPHRERMREWLAANRKRPGRPVFAIAPAAAYGPAKEWPADSYGALIDLLAQSRGRRSRAGWRVVGAREVRRSCGGEQIGRDDRSRAHQCRRADRIVVDLRRVHRQRFRVHASGGSAGDPDRRDFRIDQSESHRAAGAEDARDLPQARMQSVPGAHLPLRSLQLPDANRTGGACRRNPRDARVALNTED